MLAQVYAHMFVWCVQVCEYVREKLVHAFKRVEKLREVLDNRNIEKYENSRSIG